MPPQSDWLVTITIQTNYCTWSKVYVALMILCLLLFIFVSDSPLLWFCLSHTSQVDVDTSMQSKWRWGNPFHFYAGKRTQLLIPNFEHVQISMDQLWWHHNLARYKAKGRCRKLCSCCIFFCLNWTEDYVLLALISAFHIHVFLYSPIAVLLLSSPLHHDSAQYHWPRICGYLASHDKNDSRAVSWSLHFQTLLLKFILCKLTHISWLGDKQWLYQLANFLPCACGNKN